MTTPNWINRMPREHMASAVEIHAEYRKTVREAERVFAESQIEPRRARIRAITKAATRYNKAKKALKAKAGGN